MSTIDYAKKFRMNVVNRYLQHFSMIAEKDIFPKITTEHVKVINCYHLAERLIDRNVAQEFAVKLLSYVFENHFQKLKKDADTFIHYKDVIFLINCKKDNEGYSFRMNTILKETEITYIKSKGVPVQHIKVDFKNLMNYDPEYLKKKNTENKLKLK